LTDAAAPFDAPARRRSSALFSKLGRGLRPYGLILPKLVFFGVFLVFPIGWAIVLSFESGSILGTMQYVGLSNYERLWSDSLFRRTRCCTR
jgi:multiple sugar transport system permease protein